MNKLLYLMMTLGLATGVAQAQFNVSGGLGGSQPQAVGEQETQNIAVSASASTQAYEEGSPFYISLDAVITPPWHAYYRNPATAGMPMTAELKAPDGFRVEGPYWQPPHVEKSFYTVYGYMKETAVVWKITPLAGAPAEAQFTISGMAQLCCDTGCAAPLELSTAISLPKGAPTAAPAWKGQERTVEVLGDTPLDITITQDSDKVTIIFPAGQKVQKAYFFSADNTIAPHVEQTLTREGDTYKLSLTRNDNSDPLQPVADESLVGKPISTLKGILTFDDKHLAICYDLSSSPSAPVSPPAPEPAPQPRAETEASLQQGGEAPIAADTEPEADITVRAVSSTVAYEPGQSFYIALDATITQPWHAYFRNPATVGLPMTASMQAPEGFTVEGPYWQPPHREEGFCVSYGYVDQTSVVWKLTPHTNAPAEAVFSLSGEAQLCCDTGCAAPVNLRADLSLKQGKHSVNPQWNSQEQSVEVLGDTPLELSISQTETNVSISFSYEQELQKAYFFSADNAIAPAAEQKLTRDGNRYTLTLQRNDNSDPMYPAADESLVGKPLPKLSGILTFDGKHLAVAHDFSATPNTPAVAETQDSPSPEKAAFTVPKGFLLTAGSLFLGGLILNLMPCVFPVLGLKVMSFVELGGGDRRKVFLHSLVFVLGILVSFWIISLLLVIFSNLELLAQVPWTEWGTTLLHDTGSESRSWAKWMENPWAAYGITMLLLTIALNMYGVFEIGVGATGAGQNLQNKSGLSGSFFQGLFVTIVATPCSAPFIGSSLPAAMAMPAVWLMLAMTFMGLGLAFPYIVLGACPALISKLPRPGAWMESLKQGLSFLLLAAAAWFLTVYLAFIPEEHIVELPWMFMSIVLFCAGCWVYGRWCPMYRSKTARTTGFIIALLLCGTGIYYSMPLFTLEQPKETLTSPTDQHQHGDAAYVVAEGTAPIWNDWSPSLMAKALQDGKPVYVDFTARWCATCLANKKVAYTDDVYRLFAEKGVVLMRADKTRPNPDIDAELRRLKRGSVPTNALYLPGQEPIITSELLTADYMTEFLHTHLQTNP